MYLDIFFFLSADLSEWLRRWTWNPLGIARVGSNPTVSALYKFSKRLLGLVVWFSLWVREVEGSIPSGAQLFKGCDRIVVSTFRCGRKNPGSIPGRDTYNYKKKHPWCSGNISAFQAGAPGSIPGGCSLMIRHSIIKLIIFNNYKCSWLYRWT